LYASGVPNARTLRQGDKGTVFVSSRILDKVYAIVDKDGKREVKTLYSGLYRPNGLAIHNGTLYIAELAKISKVEKVEDNLDNPPKFGGDIAVASLNDDGTVKSVDSFLAGFIEDNKYIGRPADVLVLKDGSMLISDDFNGAVYRVSYDPASTSK